MTKDISSKDKEETRYSTQCIPITLTGIVASVFQTIVGYIVLWFFKPIWEKFVKKIKKDKNEPSQIN